MTDHDFYPIDALLIDDSDAAWEDEPTDEWEAPTREWQPSSGTWRAGQ